MKTVSDAIVTVMGVSFRNRFTRNQVPDTLWCKHRRKKRCVRDLHLEEAAAQSPQLGSILVILHIGKDETLVALNA